MTVSRDTRARALSYLVVAAGILVLAITTPARAGAGQAALESELDAALQQGREATGAPAATAAVMRCGQLLWSGANGVMDTESGRPAKSDTRFMTASTGKPMTAALVLDLVQRGKLKLKTRLSRFYPKLPKARKITIRMLLDHTAGLNEYFDDPKVSQALADPGHRWTRAEVLRGIKRTLFKPGTNDAYSNSGYVVLGGVVEKVTKKPFAQVFSARVAGPLGMTSSIYQYQPERSDLFAHPYVNQSGQLRDGFAPGIGVPSDYWGPVWTDGGLATTAEDLTRFGDGLFEKRLLRAATLKKMTTLNRFANGLGLFRKQFAGRAWFGHDGAYFGYEAEIWNHAGGRLTIGVTTNTSRSAEATWEALVTAYDRSAPTGAGCPD